MTEECQVVCHRVAFRARLPAVECRAVLEACPLGAALAECLPVAGLAGCPLVELGGCPLVAAVGLGAALVVGSGAEGCLGVC
ncbi:MAG: hypothetical protein ACKOFW_18900, partial [Planctomycetaceae bacterium]